MSDFHYVRTEGPDGGVDAADGRAIGLDLRAVLAEGRPPFNIAVQIITAMAEILSIAEEDGVVHGDITLADVLVDDTGAVSLEGFGRPNTHAPEGSPGGPATDRFGLGLVAYALLAPVELGALPRDAEGHENAAIDAVLNVDLGELPEEQVGDVQWFLARLLSWEPGDRPAASDTWQAFARVGEALIGPAFAPWCSAALEGGGQRRDRLAPSGSSWDLAPLVSVSDGPMQQGGLDFDDSGKPKGRSTGAWTRDGMKEALQRVMASDYLEDPHTDWMPGTPIPATPRDEGPRAADDFRSAPRSAGPAPARPFSGAFDEEFASPGPTDDSKTEVGSLSVPTNRPAAPAPARPKRTFVPDSPTVPSPAAAQQAAPPSRPSRGPAKDPDTAPQLVARPGRAAAPSDAADAPLVAAPVGAPSSPPAAAASAPASPPRELSALPDNVQLPAGPDPFADLEVDNSGTYVVWGAVALFLVVATGFCVGVGGVGGVAVFGMQGRGSGFEATTQPTDAPPLAVGTAPDAAPSSEKPVSVAPGSRPTPSIQPRRVAATPRSTAPAPSPRRGVAPAPRPVAKPVFPRSQPGGFSRSPAPAAPVPAPAPTRPAPSFTTPARRPSLPAPAPRQAFVAQPAPDVAANPRSRPRPGLPTFDDAPASKPVTVAPRAGFNKPMAQLPPVGGVPSLPIGDEDSIVTQLLPGTVAVNPDQPKTALQGTMVAHLNAATAARDAVIAGDSEAARSAVRVIGLINPPDALPPNWAPYVADMKMEAWLMENSPDIPAAAFKVAQLGQSCAVCHAGMRAGPTVTADAIPPRQFTDEDVMKRHGWASDWMWVGLLANDTVAWERGAAELDQSPFPSVVHAEFPEQKFMDLEDRLHQLATEAKRARTPDQRGVSYGKILATCSRCHDAYRKADGLGF